MLQDFQLPDSISLDGGAPTQGADTAAGPSRWDQLQDVFGAPEPVSLLTVLAFMTVGGFLAIYLRFLYRRTSRPLSSDSIAKVFPLLTVVTIAVIAVVKASLALSLGLVGALSIVRFRAAIKDPEELVYLFLCIGVGLSLGAEQLWLALALVAVASIFAIVIDRVDTKAHGGDAFLTIVGDAGQHFAGTPDDALEATRALWPHLTVHRCDVDGDEGQLRVQLHRLPPDNGPQLVADVRKRLPDCQVSYVNADSVV